MSKQTTSGIWQAPPSQFEMPTGLPRPLFGGLPVPFTAAVDMQADENGVFTMRPDFADVDWDKMHECRSEIRCLVCGSSLEGEAAMIVTDLYGNEPHWSQVTREEMDDLEVREGGAFCVRCAKLTKAHCPAMSKPNSGVIMVGPAADIRYDDDLDKIVECPVSFRRLELTPRCARAVERRAPEETVLGEPLAA